VRAGRTLRVDDLRLRPVAGGEVELSAAVTSPSFPQDRLWFRYPETVAADVAVDGTAFLPGLLAAAMRCGEELRIEAPVEATLLRHARQAMKIYHQWDRAYRVVDIATDGETEEADPGKGAVTFFTGGVDSFYTLLNHRPGGTGVTPTITDLLFFHGFDSPLARRDLSENHAATVRAVAEETGLRALIASSNVHDLTEWRVPWAVAHGGGMAGGVLPLRRLYRAVYVPSSHVYADDLPAGSHPILDPLWSTANFTCLHDGCDAYRTEKVARIAGSDTAMRHLRVCHSQAGTGNCGVCEKCLRTKINFLLADALDRAVTLPGGVSVDQVRSILITDEVSLQFVRENLEDFRRAGGHPEYERALRQVLRRWARWKIPLGLLRRARANRWLARPTAAIIRGGRKFIGRP